MSDTQQRIDELVKGNDILLFMKGSASFPMCGFSGRAIQILKACGVDPKSIATVNVLDDAEIRQGIKEYSNCCLLYTSPSPRDYAASRMPSSA